jgi:predicted short-subunit dehydrogenase-like oxidoreductase (DUF2520 family)
MVISIVGSGNTATVLGKLLKQNNHVINEIVGRNANTVNDLANKLNARACIEIKEPDTSSDVYIIAVKDDAVAEVSAQLNLDEQIVVHSCGSVPMNILERTSENYGVMYPLQSLRKELNYPPVIPFLIDGNNERTKKIVFDLASSISDSVITTDDETRLQYHLSAIIVSNFSNHLFALAKEYCNRNEIDFNLLLPLIEEVVNRLRYHEPSAMQTGPAIRGDEIIIQKHLRLLTDLPQLKKIYEVMSESIRNLRKS